MVISYTWRSLEESCCTHTLVKNSFPQPSAVQILHNSIFTQTRSTRLHLQHSRPSCSTHHQRFTFLSFFRRPQLEPPKRSDESNVMSYCTHFQFVSRHPVCNKTPCNYLIICAGVHRYTHGHVYAVGRGGQ